MTDGTVRDWSYGELGDGTTICRLFPITVTGLTNVKQLAGASRQTAALMEEGTLMAWGINITDVLGIYPLLFSQVLR
ncbi:hypothetical protein [Paenibacillus sp. IITD108]|uniref:hypothetical protein n=1 Tax=Paenibacillus sp. IITD108 TaxID=3116649 RepID=UPI002F3FAB57